MLDSMLVTLLGIVTDVNFVQLVKAERPIFVMVLGMVIDVKLHPSKALLSMLVTLSGIIVLLQPAINVWYAVFIMALQLLRES